MTKRRRRRNLNLPAVDPNLLTPYYRVSTREQAESRAGLDSQRFQVEGNAVMKGWTLTEARSDPGCSAKDLDRPGLQLALGDVREGRSSGIVVAKLDRLSRSVLDFANLLAEAEKEGWNVICLDLGINLKTSSGRLIAGIIATIAQWEREVIGERTRDGLAQKRVNGVRLGRPRVATDGLLETVLDFFEEQGGFSATARALTSAGIVTPTGKAFWHPASVRNLLYSQDGAFYDRNNNAGERAA